MAFDPSEIRGAFGGMQLRGRGRDSGARTAVDPRKKAAMLSKKRTAIGRLKTGDVTQRAPKKTRCFGGPIVLCLIDLILSYLLCLLTFRKNGNGRSFDRQKPTPRCAC